jgi:hypothetical protein
MQSSRKTIWPTSHSDFLSCRIQESECKLTDPNKSKNNFTCLLLYQLVTNCLFSHKNIKLFLQWLLSTKSYQFSISCFSNANKLYIFFWLLFVKTSLLWSKILYNFFFNIHVNKAKYFIHREIQILVNLFNHLS